MAQKVKKRFNKTLLMKSLVQVVINLLWFSQSWERFKNITHSHTQQNYLTKKISNE